MQRIVFAAALFGAALLATSGATAEEPAKLTKKELAKLMKDTHTGAKSPHARTVEQLAKESPDWAQVSTDAKAFAAMTEAFKKVELGYTSPAKYNDSAAALVKAAGAKDKKAAADAFTGLTKSCSSCHYGK